MPVNHQASVFTDIIDYNRWKDSNKTCESSPTDLQFNRITPCPPHPINAMQRALIPKDRKVVVMETTQACFHPPIDEVLCGGPDVARRTPVPHSDADPLVLHSRRPDAATEEDWDKMVNRAVQIQLFLALCVQAGAAAAGTSATSSNVVKAGRFCVE